MAERNNTNRPKAMPKAMSKAERTRCWIRLAEYCADLLSVAEDYQFPASHKYTHSSAAIETFQALGLRAPNALKKLKNFYSNFILRTKYLANTRWQNGNRNNNSRHLEHHRPNSPQALNSDRHRREQSRFYSAEASNPTNHNAVTLPQFQEPQPHQQTMVSAQQTQIAQNAQAQIFQNIQPQMAYISGQPMSPQMFRPVMTQSIPNLMPLQIYNAQIGSIMRVHGLGLHQAMCALQMSSVMNGNINGAATMIRAQNLLTALSTDRRAVTTQPHTHTRNQNHLISGAILLMRIRKR